MKKKTFERIEEAIYQEKLSNGIDVYMYPTDKTKNFYMSISVKYGANVLEYKLNNKIYDVIPGSAHFLEHKVMALSENKEISKRINELGSLANAWTSYYGTNYNLFGSINLRENLKLLLDIFYNININEKSVNEEKGIIDEEIDMYEDKIDSYLSSHLLSNMFEKSYAKNTVVGSHADIAKINAKSLKKIYNDYYLPNNTFIIICGNFDVNTIINDLNEYMKNIKIKNKSLPKRVKKKDNPKVYINYEEVKKDYRDDRVKIGFKINKKIFNIKDDDTLKCYLNILLTSNFSASGKLYEEYKNESIVYSMNSCVYIIDDYVVIMISALCNDAGKFIDRVKEDIKNITISNEDFERKKKLYLKTYILSFDNIEDIEYIICLSLLTNNKIETREYSLINKLKYSTCKSVLSKLNFDNISIIRTIK